MADTSLFYWNDKLGKTQPREIRLVFKITGAKASQLIVPGGPVLSFYDALSSQAQINSFLGTTDEFLLSAFDSTAMGADAFAGIINMSGNTAAGTGNGQVALGVQMKAICYSSGNTVVTRQTQALGLTASTLETAFAVGAYGNMAFKVDFGNTPDFDGLTSGTIEIILEWISK